jgi:hypothetical protein
MYTDNFLTFAGTEAPYFSFFLQVPSRDRAKARRRSEA